MNEAIIKMLLSYAVPAFLILISMYYWIKSLKRDVAEIKQTIKTIADQQIEITRIHERLDHHAYRLERLEED